MLTNIPTTSSNTDAPRPATGVPITTSSAVVSRASNTARAACITMNRDEPFWCASSFKARWISGEKSIETTAPSADRFEVRGLSRGSGKTSGIPDSFAVQ